ncbi:ATPase [Rhodoblastus acidophilus]|uniref:ATPase n=1 Tax=Rhodoblastus acidophilus TaxID=1074 RepID=A0A6N8DNU7_RHOAC|nr:ATPase [Rhodoblastus acidophilus]MCW2274312.1 hypothetical protein [Rhodoblastus acidophilus]MTV31235.1 ATPase [Rhodoblastus acidophilus]
MIREVAQHLEIELNKFHGATMIANWIEFGQVSAERDDNLSEYFFENGVLQLVIGNRHQFLVLGRKGAGKTAVFKHLSENPKKFLGPNDIATSLSLQNYSWDVHSLLSTDGKAPSLAYIHSWKYVIYLFALKELISKNINSPKIKIAKQIIEKVYTSPFPKLGDVLGQKLLQLSKLKLPSGTLDFDGFEIDKVGMSGGEITFSDVKKNNSLQISLNRSLERLSDIFEDALLDTLGQERRVFVTFDRIDEAWDSASFESSQRIIAGLIGAAEAISGKFRGVLRPVIFLREDIFDTLSLNDKNKLKSDCGQLLAWTKDGLSRMILERVNFFARKSNNSEFADIDGLFDRNQMRQARAPFDYIMLRTMLRPRDFIRLLQLVKEDMQNRQNNPFDKDVVNNEKLECRSIYNAEAKYSDWLIQEIRDEWQVQFPRINTLFSAIQNHGATTLTAEDLCNSLRQLERIASTRDINADLRFLFDNSIIGFRVGKSQQWKFKCFFTAQGFVESAIYKVHDGLHSGLNLTERRKS